MAWTTPEIIDVPCSMEINLYAVAEV